LVSAGSRLDSVVDALHRRAPDSGLCQLLYFCIQAGDALTAVVVDDDDDEDTVLRDVLPS
jgi:hypothetical protein